MKLRLAPPVFVAFLTFQFGAANSTAAAIYYVKKTGSDSYSCKQITSESTPARTINKALNCIGTAEGAGAGKTVLVFPGEYNEWINNNMPGGTSWSAPFHLKASDAPGTPMGKRETIIKPSAGQNARRVLDIRRTSSKYFIVEGFKLDGVNASGEVIKFSTDTPATFWRIIDNEITNDNVGRHGILTGKEPTDGEIIGNWIHRVGRGESNQMHGIYGGMPNLLIERNVIEWTHCRGISIHNASGEVTGNNNIIRYNIVRFAGLIDSLGFCKSSTVQGVLVREGNDFQVYGNIVYGHSGRGIDVHTRSTRAKVYNNTVYNNGGRGIEVRSGASNTEIKNNIIWQNSPDTIQDNGTNTIIANNLIGTNPRFVDAATGNLRLKADSPAIDKGLTLTMVATDFDGTTRPQGNAYDIGAFEHKQTTATAPSRPTNLQTVVQ